MVELVERREESDRRVVVGDHVLQQPEVDIAAEVLEGGEEIAVAGQHVGERAPRASVVASDALVVLCCKLVNRMQSDLTEAEFREFVITLARHFQGAPFDESAFPGA